MINYNSKNNINDSEIKKSDDLFQLHLKKARERIANENKAYFERLQEEFLNKPAEGQTKEEKELNKKRLLNYVHRYVFLNRLQPIDSNVNGLNDIVNNEKKVKSILAYYLLFRNVAGNFFKLRSILIIFSF